MAPRTRPEEEALHDQTNLLPRRQLILVFGVLALSLFICFIDQNGVSVTLPSIARDLDAQNSISWAGTSSLIANTSFQVLYGRLSDIFGRKIIYLSCLVLLCVADIVCGFSQNKAMFYVFRGLAGIADGGIITLSMVITTDIVSLERRGKFQGILGAMIGLANLIGPLLAAVFTVKATWRALFWFISPIAAACAIIDYFLLPSTMPAKDFREKAKQIDYLGVITGSMAMIFLLIPISGGGAYYSWSSPLVISFLVIGSLSLIAFLYVELRIAKLPLMPLYLWRSPALAAMLIQSVLLGITFYAFLYFLPLYFQNVLGKTPIMSAVYIIPLVFGQSSTSILSGQYISRLKRYGEVLYIGFFLWTLGMALSALFNVHSTARTIAPILYVVGVGTGGVFQPTIIAMQAHATKAQRAVVLSNRNVLRAFGGAVGLAIASAVLQAKLRASLPAGYEHFAHSTYSAPDYATLPPQVAEQVREAYAQASHAVFVALTPFIAVCFLLCFFVKDHGLTRKDERAVAGADKAAEKTAAATPASEWKKQKEVSETEAASPGSDHAEGAGTDKMMVVDKDLEADAVGAVPSVVVPEHELRIEDEEKALSQEKALNKEKDVEAGR